MRAGLAASLVVAIAAGGCATARPAVRAEAPCPAFEAVLDEAPLPERPNRWWWSAGEPGRLALRSSYGLDGCPPVLQTRPAWWM